MQKGLKEMLLDHESNLHVSASGMTASNARRWD